MKKITFLLLAILLGIGVNAQSTDATLSDLTVDGVTVTAFDAATLIYDVELAAGTTTVPAVVGVATNAAATVVVNDASSLPGSTTVVVTAEDGATEITYTINFTVAYTSIAINAPTDQPYILNARVNPGVGPFARFYMLNGEVKNSTSTNVGPTLMKYSKRGTTSLFAELEGDASGYPKTMDGNHVIPAGVTYVDVQLRVDPINYTYSMSVMLEGETEYSVLTEDSPYYVTNMTDPATTNKIDLTHIDVEGMEIISWDVTPITSIAINAPTDKPYLLNARVSPGVGPFGRFYMLNGEVKNSTATNVGPTLMKSGRRTVSLFAELEGDASGYPKTTDGNHPIPRGVTFVDVQLRVDPINYTYSMSVMLEGETEYTVLTENSPYYVTNMTDPATTNKIDLTHIDVLGMKVISWDVTPITSIAINAPTDMLYVLNARVNPGVGPFGRFYMLNGELKNSTATNVGPTLMKSGRRAVSLFAELEGDASGYPKVTDGNHPIPRGVTYADVQIKVDPINFKYSMSVMLEGEKEYTVLTEDSPYYVTNMTDPATTNKIDLTHIDVLGMEIISWDVTPITAVALENVPTDAVYKFSATIKGDNRSALYLYNNADGFTPADTRGFTNVGPNAFLEQGNVLLGTKTGVKSILGKTNEARLNIVFSDIYEATDVRVKFDIEYIINPNSHTYTFRIRRNGEADDKFFTVCEDKPFFSKQQADGTYVYNKFPLTHYQTKNLIVENAKVELYNVPLNISEEGKDYTVTATVSPTAVKNTVMYFLSDDKEPSFMDGKNMGPVVSFMMDNSNISTWEGWSGRRPVYGPAVNDFAWQVDAKYDIKLDANVTEFTYSLYVKNNGEADDKYVLIADQQDYYYSESRGIKTYKENTISHYRTNNLIVENVVVTMHKSTDATLSELKVDDTPIDGFEASILEYNYELAAGTTTVPTVTAIVNEPNATVVITDATELPGTSTIEVTAEDGVTVTTYKVNFTVAALGIENITSKGSVYPNPTTGILNIEYSTAIETVEVYNITGATVKVIDVNKENKVQVNISDLESGIYFVKIKTDSNVAISRIVKQ